MTAGTGDIHEGFMSAAQLVIDRLAGYIATRGLQGTIKVWISGFSRAAAVSNVVAGTLVKTCALCGRASPRCAMQPCFSCCIGRKGS